MSYVAKQLRMTQVVVSEGRLEGALVENRYGGSFYSFKGIPYAQPPVGDLRFKAPQPPLPWEGIRSAKEFGPMCFQVDIETNTGVHGSEDGLYLNVYTPNTTPKKPLPVMVWIHGGGFTYGSGNDDYYSPEFLIKEDVIVVTFNYRLGVLGFLCLHTKEIPGNAGIKDQVQALRWVNKNIAQFGGDPNNITIFGESAGGVSVSYHLLSPMSKGLFKRAIVQSGAALCYFGRAPTPRERAFALAKKLGCDSEDVNEVVNFFNKLPVKSFELPFAPIAFIESTSPFGDIDFTVVAEKEFEGTERFFDGNFEAVSEGVELMIGYTTDEGLIKVIPADSVKSRLEIAKEFPETVIHRSLAFNLTLEQQLKLGQKFKSYYFKFGKEIDVNKDWRILERIYAMDTFVHGTYNFAKIWARKNRVFLYKFSCKTERNQMASLFGLSEIVGNEKLTSHADDLFYLFDSKILPNKVDTNSDTYQLIQRVVKLWTQFGKFGNPTPDNSLGVKWIEYNEKDQDYLEIGNEFKTAKAPDVEEMKFWDDIYKEFGVKQH